PMAIKVNNQPLDSDPGGFPRGTINLGHLVPDTSTGSPQYTINVQVSDPNGLHQVELIAPMLVDACCGQFYDPEGIALAKYITANNADTSPNVAGYINPSNLTAWRGMIDITKWVEGSLERGENELRLFFTAIDSQGNIFTTHWGSLCISQTLVGDVTGDGKVTVQDLVAVALAMFDETDKRIRIINIDADVNCDGEVSIEDLVIVAAALHAGAAAPAPAALRQQGAAHLTQEQVQYWLTQAQQANLTDATSVRGIRFLEQLLSAMTPKETALLPNYPNPFNPETWIPYQLSESVDVTLTIYDIQGREVRTLDLGHQRAGMYHTRSRAAYWDGKNAVGEPIASGVYFYTLTAGEFSATRKLLIRK
ncbi:T9SS type A sorting domain-containing protein, partial [Candidatus Poribacteria bacterium]|nr:T9SS type A sorting domain-containing protein [Candidatus Poribacteria bacterium]